MDKKDGGTIDRMTNPNKLADALRNLVDMLREHPAMQGREHIHLGIAATNALREYDVSLAAAPQPAHAPVQVNGAVELPPLPEPTCLGFRNPCGITQLPDMGIYGYTADQVRACQREAIAALRQPVPEEGAALALLSRMRFACGDNGKRMQDELEVYLRDLKRDADRWRHARRLFTIDDIEGAQGAHDSFGGRVSEDECIRADDAIDAAMQGALTTRKRYEI